MPTTSETIQIAEISVYLAEKAAMKGQLFTPVLDPSQAIKIYMENASLSWMNDIDSANIYQSLIAQYVLSMCGAYKLSAQAIVSGGGGSVSPVTPALLPSPYQFVVSASSTPMVTGQSSVTLSNFVGYNLIFIRGGITQSTVNTGGTYYSFDSSLGLFTCYGAADEGELFQLYAV